MSKQGMAYVIWIFLVEGKAPAYDHSSGSPLRHQVIVRKRDDD